MTSEHYRSAHEIVDLIRTRQISPVEIMEDTLRRIEKVNPLLNAFVALRAEEALKEARNLEKRIAAGGEPGPLAGVPIGVKDLEDAQGLVTSFGSVPYKDNVARQDSVQVARLKEAGALMVGKTNTPEFGFTGFTRNLLFGITRNPWNPERTPGGSSGGSASSVSSGMVPVATGSDAGGSIRIPASYSGCFRPRPTTSARRPLNQAPTNPLGQSPETSSRAPDTLLKSVTTALHVANRGNPLFLNGLVKSDATSAVLCLLGEHPRKRHPYEPCIILNKRSMSVRQPGDLCFSGGRISLPFDLWGAKMLSMLPFMPLGRWVHWPHWRFYRRREIKNFAVLFATGLRESYRGYAAQPFDDPLSWTDALSKPGHVQPRALPDGRLGPSEAFSAKLGS